MVNRIPPRIRGVWMVIVGASLWGISGTVAQVLFQRADVEAGWLVSIRLLISGLALVAMAAAGGRDVWAPWKTGGERGRFLLFGLAGMLGVQYTFFAAVAEGNAATATLLQFLSAPFITVFLALRWRRMPGIKDMSALALAMVGTFFLVTNGSFGGLTVPLPAVIWGLLSAITAAFYTMYPVELIRRHGSTLTVGWGMLIGGFFLSLIRPPWGSAAPDLSWEEWGLVAFVIVFGTLIPFHLFLDSLRYITPDKTGMLGSAEPLSAMLVSIVWLGHRPGLFELVGGLCIIVTVILLSRAEKPAEKPETAIRQAG
ncbi:DMT family transporter [Staphylospora marina]|uniref:DMT family transporter n=1 Tax=Staphylospora marina TaxID=2490858 RepID=UPI001F152D93|nr:DMT family transporter [Staphylospora marina]